MLEGHAGNQSILNINAENERVQSVDAGKKAAEEDPKSLGDNYILNSGFIQTSIVGNILLDSHWSFLFTLIHERYPLSEPI